MSELDALRKVAEAATAREWGDLLSHRRINTAYIAALSPDVALALLDELRDRRAEVAVLQSRLDDIVASYKADNAALRAEVVDLKERIVRLIDINHTQAMYRENEELKWEMQNTELAELRTEVELLRRALRNAESLYDNSREIRAGLEAELAALRKAGEAMADVLHSWLTHANHSVGCTCDSAQCIARNETLTSWRKAAGGER